MRQTTFSSTYEGATAGAATLAVAAARLIWDPQVACRTLEGTAFILANSLMCSLNGVGTRVWELFEHGATLAQVCGVIQEEFDAPAEVVQADMIAFVEQLLQRRMLVALPVASPDKS